MRRVALIAWDCTVWAVALFAAAFLREEFQFREIEFDGLRWVIVLAILVQIVVGGVLHTYRGRHVVGSIDDAVNVAGSIAITAAAVITANLVFFPALTSRSVPIIATPIALVLAVGARTAVRTQLERSARTARRDPRRVVVFGAGDEAERLVRSMLADPSGAYHPVALLDDEPQRRRRRIVGVPVRGTHADIATAASATRADLLVMAGPTGNSRLVRELARDADAVGLDVMVVPPLAELLQPLPPGLMGPRADDQADPDSVGRGVPAGVLGLGKRAFDLASCLVLITLIFPILAAIVALLAIAGGPVLYRAPRVGRDGRVFMIYKFATMRPGNTGPRVTRGADPRITPVGRWLRSSKLNELPQLLNVLKGEMSLVGPRPEDPHFASFYSARQRQVLAARPGLTSPTFLEYGDEQAFLDREHPDDIESYYLVQLMPRKLDIELRYLTGWTMREDLRILAWTAIRLVHRGGGVKSP